MKARILAPLFALIIAASLAPSDASAGIKASQLAGTWNGEIVIEFGGKTHKETVSMKFNKAGKVTVQAKTSKKTEQNDYKIKGDEIHFLKSGSKEVEVVLAVSKFSTKSLTGSMKPGPNAKQALPPGFKMSVSLKKK